MKKNAVLFSAGEYNKSNTLSIKNLSGVKYDIMAIKKRLLQIGFDIVEKENCKKAEYIPALESIAKKSPSDAIHIVYFSGHGGHCNGNNYIFPSDFGSLYDASRSIDSAGINIRDIISVFKGKGRLILILDACRSDDIGLSKGRCSNMMFSENVYIAYGTMFGGKSIGMKDGMSWFTEAICDEILAPNIDVDTMFKRVRQNIVTKHSIQIPESENTLLDEVILHTELSYNDIDKQVYDFVQKYGDEYTDKYGYFHGDDLIFIDAAQYFNISLLDAIWKFKKVDNKIYKDKGIDIPELPEAETKLITFLGFKRGEKFFSFDDNHTWYYNGRQIRMGEIPPLPPSMQPKLPEVGKEYYVEFNATKTNDTICITTTLPEKCEIFVWDNKSKISKKFEVSDEKIIISNASEISRIVIDSGVFTSNPQILQLFGDGCRNLIGKCIKHNPIHGNRIYCEFDF